MIKHIKTFWQDAEEVNIIGHEERLMINKFSNQLQRPILVKNNERVYVAGWDRSNIVIMDDEHGKPLLTLSGVHKHFEND